MLVAIISLVAFAATVALTIRKVRTLDQDARSARRSTVLSVVFFAVLQLAVGLYAAMGGAANDVLSPLVLNAVLTGCAWLNLERDLVRERLLQIAGPAGRFAHPLIACVILLFLAGAGATLGLEIPSNHNLLWMYPLCLLLEWSLITAIMAGVFFISQRRHTPPAVVAVLMSILGIVEYFIITFKSMPIAPGDISALSTAMAVAGTGYSYILSPFCLYGMAFMAVSVQLCRMAAMLRPQRDRGNRRALLINLMVGIACLAGVGAHVTLVDYYNTLSIQVYTWRPLESYYRQGFLPSFISGAQTIKPPVPEDYDMDQAKELISDYADQYDANQAASVERTQAVSQFDEEKPTVITIMNETFSDLSIYQNLHANYQGPQFFKNLSDTLQRGVLYVSAFGGGTCNTEFEYLTGNSMAFLGTGTYPYTIYDLTRTETLSQQFKDLGYDTTAIHPNHGTNWNRENVYSAFGFDNFLTIQDFQDAEKLRGMVTDAATYDKILQMLDENSNPQFIFDVTMQNHSGYDTGLIPVDKQVNYVIDGVSDPEVNEYLALIEESDRALEDFVNQLRKLDRKVILVFFGDHQPFFPDEFNDAWFTGESDAVHNERLWQTDYFIWANYDVAGRDQESAQDDLSVNYLSSVLMDLIGAPLTGYQKAHITLREALPAINATGYEDKSLQWYLSSAATYDGYPAGSAAADAVQARSDYAKMQYYELFRDGKDIYTKMYQSAANETDPNLAPGTTQIK